MADGALANKIYIGSLTEPTYRFYNTNLWSGLSGMFEVDVLCNELSIDEFTFTVKYKSVTGMVYRPTDALEYRDINGLFYGWIFYGIPEKDYLTNVAYGTPVWWFVEGEFFAKGYIKSIERTGRYAWKVVCQSGIGLLDAQNSVGGMYTGQTFVNVLAEILGADSVTPPVVGSDDPGYLVNSEIPVFVESGIALLQVYGHLPYSTRRNNLHALLFSVGAVIEKNSAEIEYRICYPQQSEVSVPSDRIAINGSVSVQESSNQAEVTEHSFVALASDEVVTLFDNSSSGSVANHAMVKFQYPMHDLVGTDITIHESNCNYAVISGTGTLTGKKYTHVEKIIIMSNAEEGDSIRAKRVEENHLISAANSLNTTHRVLSYFSSARTLRSKIMLDSERPGMNLALNDAFSEPTTAYLKKANVLITTLKGADCELVEGYVPAWGGNNYTQRAFISTTGSWTVPAGTKSIRLILIQGGNGGQGGYNGERGYGRLPAGFFVTRPGDFDESGQSGTPYHGWRYYQQQVAKGGSAGNPGLPGKIFIVDIQTNGGETVAFVIGEGGNGGARGGHNGASGGETTATINAVTYSSAEGFRSEVGFIDALGNQAFAMPGELGHRGGNGGTTDVKSNLGNNGENGNAGESIGTYQGGFGGKGVKVVLFSSYEYSLGSGGGGGGAAWGADGDVGGNASYVKDGPTPETIANPMLIITGAGGDGADAVAPTQPTYGNGGGGGNGGGAGGNVGGGVADGGQYNVQVILSFKGAASTTAYQHGGDPGLGSSGGKGGDGCAIIYY